MTHALYLLDPDPAPAWAPFAGARPLCELRAGAHLIRERWETFIGAESSAIFALPHLAGFAEAGVPLVAARRPVPGPAVIGSSTFAPRGLAPSLPEGAFRLTSGGVTVGWGVGAGATWDGPQPHAAAIEVPGVVLHGTYDLVPALEQLLPAPGLGIEKRPEAVGDEPLGQARVLGEDEVGDDLIVAVRDHVRAQLASRLDGLLSLQVRPRDSSETGVVAADAGANLSDFRHQHSPVGCPKGT